MSKKPGMGLLIAIGKGKVKPPKGEEVADEESGNDEVLKLDAAQEFLNAVKSDEPQAVCDALEALLSYLQ